MSGTKFAVTPQLPASIVGIFPIVVEKAGLAYTISFESGVAGTVTKKQWFEAVALLYDMNTLFTAVAADANDPAWIQFYGGYGVTSGDALSTLTQTTFTLTSVQLAALFALAATLEP